MKISYTNELKLYFFILLLLYAPFFVYNILLVQIRGDFLLAAVFYFSIIKRFNISSCYLIFIGLLNDELHNNVLGAQALIYVLVNFFGNNNSNSLFKQKFSIVWTCFVTITISSILIKYIIALLVTSEPISVKNEFTNALATILLYVPLHYIFTLKLNWFMYSNAR